ncbi:MAG TPA: 3',5'-cyclic-nucleotide phosphodiesterase [Blastocatellia bacterium]|nr:3',5'-cyclic-nucleotide phosphodiesterase [Blastocatellia bacterium]
MKVRLLPSNVSRPIDVQTLTSFIVNDRVVIDGGSIGFALAPNDQIGISHFVVTHTHADHIASLPIIIADVYTFLKEPIVIYGVEEVVHDLKLHVFNNKIWPDFTQIPLPDGSEPTLKFVTVEEGVPFDVDGLQITPIFVNHPVVCTGLLVYDGEMTLAFTSDTYKTDRFWAEASKMPNLKAVFVDVSFPSTEEPLAERSGHLTPHSLNEELPKLSGDPMVYAVHIKPFFRSAVIKELSALGNPRIEVANINREYFF